MPQVFLDIGTLTFATALLAFLASGFSFVTANALASVRQSARSWGWAMFTLGVACVLWFLTPHEPRFFSFVLGNTMSVAAPIFGLRAISQAARRRFSLQASIGVFVVGVSGIVATYCFDIERTAAVLTIASTHLLIALLGGWMLGVMWRDSRSPYALATGLVLLLLGSGTAARIWVTLFGAGAVAVLPVAPSNTQIYAIATGTVLIVAGSFGLLGMLGEQARQQILDSASRDSLTGLFTRGAFYERALTVLGSRPSTLSLLLLDLDHFKRINDTYGHLAGDAVIRHAARLILRSSRGEDIPGRYGGEEFCILLPGCGAEMVKTVAERFVTSAAQQMVRLPDGQTIHFTMSIGYVTCPENDRQAYPSLEAMVDAADRALYEAKRQGRNRAVGAGEHAPNTNPVSIGESHQGLNVAAS